MPKKSNGRHMAAPMHPDQQTNNDDCEARKPSTHIHIVATCSSKRSRNDIAQATVTSEPPLRVQVVSQVLGAWRRLNVFAPTATRWAPPHSASLPQRSGARHSHCRTAPKLPPWPTPPRQARGTPDCRTDCPRIGASDAGPRPSSSHRRRRLHFVSFRGRPTVARAWTEALTKERPAHSCTRVPVHYVARHCMKTLDQPAMVSKQMGTRVAADGGDAPARDEARATSTAGGCLARTPQSHCPATSAQSRPTTVSDEPKQEALQALPKIAVFDSLPLRLCLDGAAICALQPRGMGMTHRCFGLAVHGARPHSAPPMALRDALPSARMYVSPPMARTALAPAADLQRRVLPSTEQVGHAADLAITHTARAPTMRGSRKLGGATRPNPRPQNDGRAS